MVDIRFEEPNEDKSADMLSREELLGQTYENIYACLVDARRYGKMVRDYQKREHRWIMEDDLYMRNHVRTLARIEDIVRKSEVEAFNSLRMESNSPHFKTEGY